MDTGDPDADNKTVPEMHLGKESYLGKGARRADRSSGTRLEAGGGSGWARVIGVDVGAGACDWAQGRVPKS